jgi:hypothetical protein
MLSRRKHQLGESTLTLAASLKQFEPARTLNGTRGAYSANVRAMEARTRSMPWPVSDDVSSTRGYAAGWLADRLTVCWRI